MGSGRSLGTSIALLVLAIGRAVPAGAAAASAESAEEVAKKLQNPVADMVSIPFQFNWINGVGPQQDLRYVLNIQPVVPFHVTPQWNLIGRWIMPYIAQPASLGSASGYGDITASAFFSPSQSKGTIVGVGPVLSLPTTTDPTLGSGKWSAGPTVVVLTQQGPWTYGLLWNQLWSFASTGSDGRLEVSQGFFQPFLAHSTRTGATLTIQSEMTANWLAPNEGDTWTIPINVILSKVTKLGPFPFSAAGGVGAYVAKPDGGPDWQLRTVFTVILPGGK